MKTLNDEKNQDAGSICGGVIPQSLFLTDPELYMMVYYMPDERFEQYKKITNGKKKILFFRKYARSAI